MFIPGDEDNLDDPTLLNDITDDNRRMVWHTLDASHDVDPDGDPRNNGNILHRYIDEDDATSIKIPRRLHHKLRTHPFRPRS